MGGALTRVRSSGWLWARILIVTVQGGRGDPGKAHHGVDGRRGDLIWSGVELQWQRRFGARL
jgi:hypothetical protein